MLFYLNLVLVSHFETTRCSYSEFAFYCTYLNKFLKNISKEQKFTSLLREFNVNFLNYNEDNRANGCLDSLVSNSFIHLNILIDNTFSHVINPNIILGHF